MHARVLDGSVLDVVCAAQQFAKAQARAYAIGTGALTALNAAVPSEVARFYTVTIGPSAATTPPTYTITATPIAGSEQVSDGVLTLDQAGAKTRNSIDGW